MPVLFREHFFSRTAYALSTALAARFRLVTHETRLLVTGRNRRGTGM